MPDPRFFPIEGPFTVAQLAEIGPADLAAGAIAERVISDVAPLDTAGPTDLSFVDNPRYLPEFSVCRAGACVVHPDRIDAAPPDVSLLITENPYLAFARMANAIHPETENQPGIDQTASIDPTAKIADDVQIAAGAIVSKNAEIGGGSRVGPNAVIGPGVLIGQDCHIGANASVYYCLMGNRVRLFAGVRIGEAGFGFAPTGQGFYTVPQLGRVLIEDDVEIGANSTIDRGSGPDTVIGAGCRIDNLVQIGHNVRLGQNCIIVAQSGISGSTNLDNFVAVGGQAGIAGHLKIGAGAQIAGQSGIMRDVPAGERVGGNPAVPLRQFMRQASILGRLAKKKAISDG
jgi:UDP-3-O-[3-hydroxymyristoyl] glucosamine N-acyltransferase